MDIEYEIADRTALITLTAPQRRNALTLDSSAALAEAIAKAENDDNVHAVIVTGAGKAFCAGADLTVLAAAEEKGLRDIYAGFLAVAHCRLPTIAAVNGAAVGAGLNLALAADVRIAGPHARFDARFLQLGLHPGGGMTWMSQRIVGPQAAKAMTLFGQIPDAEEALRIGLVHAIADDPLAEARAYARASAEAPRDVVLATKATMRATAAITEHTDAVDAEIAPQLESLRSPEFAERVESMRSSISSRS